MNNFLSDELIQKIREVTGLRITEFDYEKLTAWIHARIKVLGLPDFAAYQAYLGGIADLSQDCQRLSDLLTTGETFFMRDPGQMELIRRVILPEIINKKRLQKHLRIWAPACATGEELYSLVILLEGLIPDSQYWDVDIVGSDINPVFIENAKVASYKEWSFRGCSNHFRNTYFQKEGDSWRLSPSIRSRARFLVLDLVNANLPDHSKNIVEVDFILCRNLFIYMNMDAINAITEKLSACLTKGGILMTAHGELHAYRQSGLQVKIYPESLVYQKIGNTAFLGSVADMMPTATPFVSPRAYKPADVFSTPLNPTGPIKSEIGSEASLAPIESIAPPPEKSSDQLYTLAWKYADQAKFKEAIDLYEKLSSIDPMQAQLHYLHAVISMEMGDIERAKSDLRKALYLDPDYIAAYLELITIQIQENKPEMASKSCGQAIKALEKMGPQESIPCLKNSTVFDLKQYLANIQGSLTSILK